MPPANDELTANPDGSITIVLVGSAGATSYNIYRGTTSGGEAATPVANTSSVLYTDTGLAANTDYFYEFTAVNACGESARGAEDSSKTSPPPQPAAAQRAWRRAAARFTTARTPCSAGRTGSRP